MSGPASELERRRAQLTERFVLLQAELGGVYYEMAIRDHLQHEVLAQRAAELQRIDAELAHVERLLNAPAEPTPASPEEAA